MSLKRRLGEGDEVPSIAAAAMTVTLSSEDSKAAPSCSGCSAEAPLQTEAQETQPEVQVYNAVTVFTHLLRDAMQGARP